jgi:hypothetical protein
MKLPNWFKILWWIILLVIVTFFLYNRFPDLTKGNATTADIFIFLIWAALCLLPLFEELSFFGITFKKEVEKLKSDITTQIDTLKADIKNTINLQVLMPAAGQISPQEEEKPPKRNSMEYKILNTLWTKQVNKFPTFSPLFTFVIGSNSPEYLQFREAGSKLIGEGLVGETETGHYHLTRKGWDWCKKHYGEFPSDQWWPEEPIIKEKLEEVLRNA